MNNTHTTTTTTMEADFNTITAALESVRQDYVASYVAHVKEEMARLRVIVNAFDYGCRDTYKVQQFEKASTKYYALQGRNYEAMAMAAWVKRIETLYKGISKKGLNLDAIQTITAVPSAGDFWMTITDTDGIRCHARAVLVLPCDKRPHMRFICT